MSGKIQGVHHIAIKPTAEQYDKTVDFYTRLLGMKIVKSWGDPQRPCLMVSCGDNSCMEILGSDSEPAPGGPLAHIAFATDKVDELVEAARSEGYEITDEPRDVDLGGMPIRIAFLYGPTQEHIELFWEKGSR
ncbi:VOC family protein [uncultured Neglectibacter sp.]|uniref:VOC family protein n=1 Tax=uncultured Neglectibacter sp. TaxID=1924108 RepID=UPI0034DE738C